MEAIIYVLTHDEIFAETLCSTLGQLGFSSATPGSKDALLAIDNDEKGYVVLLDIRQHHTEAINYLHSLKQARPEIEVILINRPDSIRISMTAMQAGAGDELIAPFDTAVLKKKIMAACRRREKLLKKSAKRSLLSRFSDAMAAATFAQAGEFDTAVDLLDGPAPWPAVPKKEDTRKKTK